MSGFLAYIASIALFAAGVWISLVVVDAAAPMAQRNLAAVAALALGVVAAAAVLAVYAIRKRRRRNTETEFSRLPSNRRSSELPSRAAACQCSASVGPGE
jgi:membrane protein implicated in regulation of membrane protease activity